MKRVILFLLLFAICNADVVFYNGIYKMVNCKVISNEENEYIVKTITKRGESLMNISKSIVNVIEFSPFDSTELSEIIEISKNDEVNITKLNKEKRDHFIEQKKQFKEEIKKEKEKLKTEKNYYYKPNIPLLATGVALTTHGVINLFNTGKLNKLINEYEASDILPESYVDDLRDNLAKAYIYGAIFTIAGAIDIYYSFEKVSVELSDNNLKFSFNF
jgi:hypothetical protein